MAESKAVCCPSCSSGKLASVQSAAFDSELLGCQDCGRAYEVKYGRMETLGSCRSSARRVPPMRIRGRDLRPSNAADHPRQAA
jgi:hypothetical protein